MKTITSHLSSPVLNKRLHLAVVALLLCGSLMLHSCQSQNAAAGTEAVVHTVDGPLAPEALGFALTHEHLMSNFGKDPSEAFRYDEAALLRQVLPHLEQVKALGVNTIFDCTTAYFGRRVDLLKKMAEESGLQIVTNTGFYGAADDRYVPEFAYEAGAEEIAGAWIKEYEEGIDGTGIRPGFIKLAFDAGPPSDIDKKLFAAGLLTHLQTGLTLAVHTGDNPAAISAQLELLQQYGVHPEAWVWVHANWSSDEELLLETASKGGWISLDGVKTANTAEYIQRLKRFRDRDLLHKVLLSHDGDGYPMGDALRPFVALPRDLIPAMLENGFTQQEVELLTVRNPRSAFSIRVRKRD